MPRLPGGLLARSTVSLHLVPLWETLAPCLHLGETEASSVLYPQQQLHRHVLVLKEKADTSGVGATVSLAVGLVLMTIYLPDIY